MSLLFYLTNTLKAKSYLGNLSAEMSFFPFKEGKKIGK